MVLLVYPPFCTPTIMPYSISYLKDFLLKNDVEATCLDLNAKFHSLRFSKQYEEKEEFIQAFESLHAESTNVYAENNKRILNGEEPELIEELLAYISDHKPEVVAFSIVYNSQNFYAKALIERLDVPVIVGGPAVSPAIRKIAKYIPGPVELVEHMGKKANSYNAIPDFSDYDSEDYFTNKIIFPYKTTSSCYYQKCAFCTHHQGSISMNLPLDFHEKYYCLIDDLISTKRLFEIQSVIGEGKFWAQLRPTKGLIPLLPDLPGLKSVAWGVESGSQRVLDLMGKGTEIDYIEKVLAVSKKAGIINTVFIMFGFPGEKEEDFHKTIEFLKRNSENIDLISTSIFGLQKGSPVYENPKKYGVKNIVEKSRTVLGSKITFDREYDVESLRKKYKKTIEGLNKLPKIYNYVKEQTLLL